MRSFAAGSCDISSLNWRKSSFSWANSDCVEVADQSGGLVRVRDSKDPGGPMLAFGRMQWDVFIGGVRTGWHERC